MSGVNDLTLSVGETVVEVIINHIAHDSGGMVVQDTPVLHLVGLVDDDVLNGVLLTVHDMVLHGDIHLGGGHRNRVGTEFLQDHIINGTFRHAEGQTRNVVHCAQLMARNGKAAHAGTGLAQNTDAGDLPALVHQVHRPLAVQHLVGLLNITERAGQREDHGIGIVVVQLGGVLNGHLCGTGRNRARGVGLAAQGAAGIQLHGDGIAVGLHILFEGLCVHHLVALLRIGSAVRIAQLNCYLLLSAPRSAAGAGTGTGA